MISKLIGNNDSNEKHLQNLPPPPQSSLNDCLTCNYTKKYYLNILNKLFGLDNYIVKVWHNNYCVIIS
jgi:hypothetical protein